MNKLTLILKPFKKQAVKTEQDRCEYVDNLIVRAVKCGIARCIVCNTKLEQNKESTYCPYCRC